MSASSKPPFGPKLPHNVGTFVSRVLTSLKIEKRVEQAHMAMLFAEVLGPAASKHAQLTRIQLSEITVAVDSASWRQQLSLLSQELLDRLNESVAIHMNKGRAKGAKKASKVPTIRSIRFIHGAVTVTEPEATPQTIAEYILSENTPEERAEADLLSRLIADGDVASAVAHAYLAAQRRK